MKSVDLHGYSLEEALIRAEKDIYQAYKNRKTSIEWITGTGPINERLLDLVRKNPLIAVVLNDTLVGLAYTGKIVVEVDIREDL